MPVPISNLSAVFADSTKNYVGLGLNVSYTAAGTGSRLFELKVNNEPKFWIGLNGVPSTNLSTVDTYSRTLAENAYDLATASVSASAAAFSQANSGNLYIANTRTTEGTVVVSNNPRVLNFISGSSNTGIDVILNDFSPTSNITISHYDVLLDNVSIAGVTSANFDNTVIKRPYRRFSFFLYEASISLTGTVTLRYSVNNGSAPTIRGMDIVTNLPAGNILTCHYFNENAQFLPRTHRRRGYLNFLNFDGATVAGGSNFHAAGSDPLADGYINWLSYSITTGGGIFNTGYVTLIGYR